MKFKAILTDQLCMKDFHNVLLTFARISKRATINVKKTGLNISNIATSITTNPLLWTTIDKDEFFTHFVMGGVDEEFDEILLSLYPEQLATALNTAKNFVKFMKIKLTKKDFPCLSIELETAPPNTTNFRRLVHDVPVTLISTRDWSEYRIPAVPKSDITIQLPSLKSLRALTDKMKNLSPTLTVCANTNGDLSFIVETDSATVVSKYFNLTVEEKIAADEENNTETDQENNEQNGQASPALVTCQIDTKQLSHCFSSFQFQNLTMIGSMTEGDLFSIKINVRENVVMFCSLHTVDAT